MKRGVKNTPVYWLTHFRAHMHTPFFNPTYDTFICTINFLTNNSPKEKSFLNILQEAGQICKALF